MKHLCLILFLSFCSILVQSSCSRYICPNDISCKLSTFNSTCDILICPQSKPSLICNGKPGSSCSVIDNENGAMIICEDGSSTLIQNGTSCSVNDTVDGAIIKCEDGTQTFIGNGINGSSCSVVSIYNDTVSIECDDGSMSTIIAPTGKAGTSCSVINNENGAIIMCEDGSNATINDGYDCNTEETDFGAIIKCGVNSTSYIYNGIPCNISKENDIITIYCQESSESISINAITNEVYNDICTDSDCSNLCNCDPRNIECKKIYENFIGNRTHGRNTFGDDRYECKPGQIVYQINDIVYDDNSYLTLVCRIISNAIICSYRTFNNNEVTDSTYYINYTCYDSISCFDLATEIVFNDICADDDCSNLIGPQGVQGLPGKDGRDGKDGSDGNDGKDGKDGTDCSCNIVPIVDTQVLDNLGIITQNNHIFPACEFIGKGAIIDHIIDITYDCMPNQNCKPNCYISQDTNIICKADPFNYIVYNTVITVQCRSKLCKKLECCDTITNICDGKDGDGNIVDYKDIISHTCESDDDPDISDFGITVGNGAQLPDDALLSTWDIPCNCPNGYKVLTSGCSLEHASITGLPYNTVFSYNTNTVMGSFTNSGVQSVQCLIVTIDPVVIFPPLTGVNIVIDLLCKEQ